MLRVDRRAAGVLRSTGRSVLLLVVAVLAAGGGIVACSDETAGGGAVAADSTEAYRQQPGYVIDSILPIAEHLRRFRVGLDSVAALSGGATDRESLVRRFIAALEARDTSAMQSLTMSRAEFAWLFYPSHPYAGRPYELPPALFWFQIQGNSGKGYTRTLARFGGRRSGYQSHACPADDVATFGEIRVFSACTIVVAREGSARDTVRLFGSIVEHRGRFKFASLANDM